MTFDQYLAQQKEKDAAIPKLEGVRKANEGADDIWKGAVPLTKNEEEGTYYVGKVLAFNIPFPYSVLIYRLIRPNKRPSLALKKKKKFISRSTHTSNVQTAVVVVVAVAIVEAIEVVAIVEVIGLVADVVVAAAVAEVDARTTTRRPLTSIVKTISPHCLDKLTLSLKKTY